MLYTKSTRSTAQKVEITYFFKTSFVYRSLNSASPYTFKYLNNGGSIQNDNMTPSAKSFTEGPNASKPVSIFTTKTMRHTRHPHHKNVTLSYPHKIDWRRLTNVWYGSFTGSEALKIYICSSLTVWRQTIVRQCYEVCELKHCRIYMSVYLFVYLSVCLSKRYIALGQ